MRRKTSLKPVISFAGMLMRQAAAFLNAESSGATATGTLRCKALVWTGATRPACCVCFHWMSKVRASTVAAYEVNAPSLPDFRSGALALGSAERAGRIEKVNAELFRERRYRVESSEKTSAPDNSRYCLPFS